MLQFHNLRDPDRERLEREIAALLGPAGHSAAPPQAETAPPFKLGASFDVWELSAAAIGSFSGRLNLVARPTGRIHHQLGQGGDTASTHAAQSVVRSEEAGYHLLRVQSVLQSNLAAQLDEALVLADQELGARGHDYRAHLLVVPSRLIHALWLEGVDDDKIVVVDMPRRTQGLERHRLYEAPEFMKTLSETEIVGTGRPATVQSSTRHFARRTSSQAPGVSSRARTWRTIHDIRSFFIIFLIGNVVWIVIVATGPGGVGVFLQTLGVYGLLSGAGLIVGGLFGFIFGIPRSLANPVAAIAQRAAVDGQPNLSQLNVSANTNLEQISDWLTKVLVGVGLTQLTHLTSRLVAAQATLQVWLAGGTHSGVIGLAILVAFGCGGFVWAYFESRTSLMQVFSNDDPPGSADAPSFQQPLPSAPSPAISVPPKVGPPVQAVDMPPPVPPTPAAPNS